MSTALPDPQPATQPAPTTSAAGAWCGLAILAVTIVAVVAIRVRLLEYPFERDEGEYAYMGQLMLEGVPPYQGAYNMKLPGTYAAYALIMAAFGQSASAVHLGLLIVNLLSGLLVYSIGRRVLSPFGAGVAASIYLTTSVCPCVYGLSAHATQFVTLFAMAGTLLVLVAVSRNSLLASLASGLAYGLAFLMKQPAVFFPLFGGLYLAYAGLVRRPRDVRRLAAQCALYALGAATPLAGTFLLLYLAGVFESFWYWTVDYAREYVGIVDLATGWQYFSHGSGVVMRGTPLVCLIAVVGFVLVVGGRLVGEHAVFLAGFAIFSFLAVCPGWYFREHYWVVLLPAVGLLVGVAAMGLERWLSESWAPPMPTVLAGVVMLGAILHTLYLNRENLLQLAPAEVSRKIYGPNPFPESEPIAAYLRENSPPEATVAILGSEPQIPFFAERRSATGFIYMYPLVEHQAFALEMQERMIGEIEQNRPRFVLLVNIRDSWNLRADSERHVFDWFETYRQERLAQVGLVEILPEGETRYLWGAEAAQARPRGKDFIAIYEDRGP